MTYSLVHGDALGELAKMPAGSVRCCVTSPPYWGLRDYGAEGQIGLEPTPEEYVARLVDVFREVRRVLSDDGTLWLNLGDSYAAQRSGTIMPAETLAGGINGKGSDGGFEYRGRARDGKQHSRNAAAIGLKHKDLVGIPWRVAFALQADGWWLRSDIIWAKPNPMPESVTDRPTKAHEYLFLLAKSERYYYDAAAILEPNAASTIAAFGNSFQRTAHPGTAPDRNDYGFGGRKCCGVNQDGRSKRSVWSIATQPYSDAHFAVMPRALVEPCILAGTARGDIVLDPFAGAGTVGLVALRHGRRFIGVDLNAQYVAMARHRIEEDAPLFQRQAVTS